MHHNTILCVLFITPGSVCWTPAGLVRCRWPSRTWCLTLSTASGWLPTTATALGRAPPHCPWPPRPKVRPTNTTDTDACFMCSLGEWGLPIEADSEKKNKPSKKDLASTWSKLGIEEISQNYEISKSQQYGGIRFVFLKYNFFFC